jgi:flagellar hook-basal body complex protein FliE
MRITTNPAIQAALEGRGISAPKSQSGEAGNDFAQQLMDVIGELNEAQSNSRELQNDLITGRRPVEYHDVMISMEKASTAMQFTLAVRNKALEAFQEINRLQI